MGDILKMIFSLGIPAIIEAISDARARKNARKGEASRLRKQTERAEKKAAAAMARAKKAEDRVKWLKFQEELARERRAARLPRAIPRNPYEE